MGNSSYNANETTLSQGNVGSVTQEWSFNDGESSPPVEVAGSVYVGGSGTFYSLDASTGAEQWSFATGGNFFSQAAVSNGVVYVGDDGGELFALDASTGAELWSVPAAGSATSSPAVVNGVVYSAGGSVYALDAQTGTEEWVFPGDGTAESSPAVANGTVFVNSNNYLYALNATTGALNWSTAAVEPLAFTNGVSTGPTVVAGIVYTDGSTNDSLEALDASDGTLLWNGPVGVGGLVAVANGVVYAGGELGVCLGTPGEACLYALDATSGGTLWEQDLGGTDNGFCLDGASVANGVLYADINFDCDLFSPPTYGELFTYVASSGQPLTFDQIQAGVNASPTVANGVIYLGQGTDVTAYALPPATCSSTTPPCLTIQVTGKGFGTVTSSPAGISCPNECQAPFSPGTLVNLSAVPARGSVFNGWGGVCANQATCSVHLTSDQTVTADFEVPVLPPVKITKVVAGNGSVRVSWKRLPIYNSYFVLATPTRNNREYPPAVYTASSQPVSGSSATVSGLIEDCHQSYEISVTGIAAVNGEQGQPAIWGTWVRPSGIVQSGVAPPPYVVILLDGIGSTQQGFTMNPYSPTADITPSYCPESFIPPNGPSGSPSWPAGDFKSPPNGPGEFFAKWNFYDPADNANGNDPFTQSNSTPRDLVSYTPSNAFMLDAIAAQGAIILPFSYEGVKLSRVNKVARFSFGAYSRCNSTPLPSLGGPGCNNLGTPKGNDDIALVGDVQELNREVTQVHAFWPSTKIVVMGHSQGGLIAWDWWQTSNGNHPGLLKAFSLDSPINGVNTPGPPEYPDFGSRDGVDPGLLSFDQAHGDPFRFVGTWGDSPAICFPAPWLCSFTHRAYGGPYSDETLQHQLLVTGSQCDSQGNTTSCPSPIPDEVSSCSINGDPSLGATSPDFVLKDAHFIVKFCPGTVAYFNTTLGLTY